MKITDLFASKTPLKIGDKVVEDAFIQELPLNKLSDLQKLTSEKNTIKKLDAMQEIIELSIVNGKDELIFKDKKLSNMYILDISNQVLEVNTPKK